MTMVTDTDSLMRILPDVKGDTHGQFDEDLTSCQR